MKNMSMTTKLIITNLVYIIPFLILVFLASNVFQQNIKFAKWEQKGLTYQRPLESLLQHIGQHSWLAQRALHGDSASQTEALKIEAQIETDIKELEKADAVVGVDLQFTKEGLALRQREHFAIPTFKSEWQSLKDSWSTLKADGSIEKHAHLISDIRGMIAHSGDTSNIILDPELDSYYLGDIILAALPQMQDRMVDIITHTEGLVRSQNLSPADRIYIATTSAFLKQSDFDRFVADAQTSTNEDKNCNGISPSLQANLPKSTAESKAQVEAMLKVLGDIAGTGQTPPLTSFLTASETAFNGSFVYWTMAADEMNKLLQIRIDAQTSERNELVIMSLVVLFLAAVGSTWIGVSIRSTVIKSVSEVVLKMRAIAKVVNESNRQLVHASESLASGTNQQASAIQETVSTLDEISSMTEKSASGAQNSAHEAKDSQAAANDSKASVQDLVRALSEINSSSTTMIDQVTDSNERIVEFVSMIQEIGNKTKVINDIVFQTKLLSFNASVEAARAGEHGKGFAVVAEEVGNLAQMSGNAAKEITTLLDQSTGKVNSIVEQTKKSLENVVRTSKEKMDAGMKIAGECEAALSTAVSKVENVTHLMAEIASATKEQATGVSEIGKAMNMLDQATQQNSATAEQAANLARELEKQASVLVVSIQELEQRIGAHSPEETPAVAGMAAPAPTSILPFKKKAQKSKSHAQQSEQKIAVGQSHSSVPDANDPGFGEDN